MTNASAPDDSPQAQALTPEQVNAAVRHLLAYAARKRWAWLAALGGMLVATLLTALVPLQVTTLLNDVIPLGAAGLPEAVTLLLLMLTLSAASAIVLRAARTALTGLGQDLVLEVRADYYASLMRQGANFYRRHDAGELTSIGLNDTEVISSFLVIHVPYFAQSGGQVLMALTFMLVLNPMLTLGALLLVGGVFLVAQRVTTPPVQRLASGYQQLVSSINSWLIEKVIAVRDIQIFTQESRTTDAFRQKLKPVAQTMKQSADWQALSTAVFQFLDGVGLVLIYGAGTLLVIQSGATVGVLAGFAFYFAQLTGPVFGWSRSTITIQSLIVAAHRVFGVLTTPPEVQDKPGAKDPGRLLGTIRFENVSFSYEPDRPDAWRLKGVDLEIRRGEKVAFVGGSGCGKTTLVNLVPRFYDVTKGRVTIDGYDVRDLQLQALRRNFSLVAQNVMLFQGTLAENIRFARPEADDAAVLDAAEVGDVTEFVQKLDLGLRTELGERGQGLSGGQKQRVSIARAALADAPLLILDEATSALDAQSERRITTALDRLTEGRTTLIITHRLHTVTNADKIVLMGTDDWGDGVIKAVGNHDELMDTSPEYADLYGRSRPTVIMMPIGPLYDTTPALPTVMGLANAYKAPVYVLDFGGLPEDAGDRHFGITVLKGRDNTQVINLRHTRRVQDVLRALRSEAIDAHVLEAEALTEGVTWVEATIRAINQVQATHFVAVDNVLVSLDTLRDAIRTIERKAAVEYILVNPIAGVD